MCWLLMRGACDPNKMPERVRRRSVGRRSLDPELNSSSGSRGFAVETLQRASFYEVLLTLLGCITRGRKSWDVRLFPSSFIKCFDGALPQELARQRLYAVSCMYLVRCTCSRLTNLTPHTAGEEHKNFPRSTQHFLLLPFPLLGKDLSPRQQNVSLSIC